MPGLLPVLTGLALAASVLALIAAVLTGPHASRLLARRVSTRAAGRPAAPRPGSSPESGEAAVPVITDAPDREERPAFACDNGLTIGERDR